MCKCVCLLKVSRAERERQNSDCSSAVLSVLLEGQEELLKPGLDKQAKSKLRQGGRGHLNRGSHEQKENQFQGNARTHCIWVKSE